ncbi:MAG TPA: HAD-IA family hydrolase [Polyangiaceae bacterium]|nr:HAD-IA family hydrolase [Polyangiaceae bacterium]
MSHKFEAVLFDLDGTLLDTLDDMLAAANFCLEQHGLELLDAARAKSFIGQGVDRFLASAVGPARQHLLSSVTAAYHRYQKSFGFERTRPYPGVEGLLQALRERGVALAVVTNKLETPARAMLDEIFGEQAFRVIRGARAGVPLKPDPAPAFAVLEALRISPRQSVVVGDTEIDVALAEAVGAPSIAVTWGFRDRAFLASTAATQIVDQIEELRALLDGSAALLRPPSSGIQSSVSERIRA